MRAAIGSCVQSAIFQLTSLPELPRAPSHSPAFPISARPDSPKLATWLQEKVGGLGWRGESLPVAHTSTCNKLQLVHNNPSLCRCAVGLRASARSRSHVCCGSILLMRSFEVVNHGSPTAARIIDRLCSA